MTTKYPKVGMESHLEVAAKPVSCSVEVLCSNIVQRGGCQAVCWQIPTCTAWCTASHPPVFVFADSRSWGDCFKAFLRDLPFGIWDSNVISK